MGLVMSFVGTGMPSTQVLMDYVMGRLYGQVLDKQINNMNEFHAAVLEFFDTVNSALPGKHYDVPSHKEVEECFEKWKAETSDDKRKELFVDFMNKAVNRRTQDDSVLITGLVTPPAAMAVKKAGENVPQLRMIKSIPDVLFVPSATVLALISVKLSRRFFPAS